MNIVIDELPNIVLKSLGTRSNRLAAFGAIQNIERLRKDCGREQADVIINIIGNLIVGQGTGKTAKHFSQLFAKTFAGQGKPVLQTYGYFYFQVQTVGGRHKSIYHFKPFSW